MAGTLYVVATPIGNLEDLTFRGLRTLKSVDLIAAEDTRRTAKLLAHYHVQKPLVSLREHNETRMTPRLIAQLQRGESIALVSDAGTPTIADPGTHLVREARAHAMAVIPIPGPSAVAAALSVSGFAADEYVFLGFPPAKGTSRTTWFEALAHETRVCVFFESPHRIERTLRELAIILVDRPIMVAREISKINETYVISPNIGVLGQIKPIGELTVIVDTARSEDKHNENKVLEAAAMFGRLTNNVPLPDDLAEDVSAKVFSVSKTSLHNLLKKSRIASRRLGNPLP